MSLLGMSVSSFGAATGTVGFAFLLMTDGLGVSGSVNFPGNFTAGIVLKPGLCIFCKGSGLSSVIFVLCDRFSKDVGIRLSAGAEYSAAFPPFVAVGGTSFLVVVPAPPIRGMGPMVIFGSTLLAILGLSGLVGGVFEVPIAGAFFNTFFLATADARPLLHYRSCPLSSFFPG